jgi:rhodanese-related sulfurtransferase
VTAQRAQEIIMKRTSIIAFAAALAVAATSFAAGPAPATAPVSKGGIAELSRAEFEQLLAKPQQLLIVDVRRPDELTRVGGFPVFLSVQIKDLENNLDLIPKGRTIVTVSNHAARSGRAADLLKAKGYEVAGTVGAQTFEEQGGTLTKFEIPQRPAPASAAVSPAAATSVGSPN